MFQACTEAGTCNRMPHMLKPAFAALLKHSTGGPKEALVMALVVTIKKLRTAKCKSYTEHN